MPVPAGERRDWQWVSLRFLRCPVGQRRLILVRTRFLWRGGESVPVESGLSNLDDSISGVRLNVFASWLVGFALLVVCFPAASASGVAAPVAYDITVRIDPATGELSGTSTIVVEPGRPVEIILARRFEVDSITIDGTPAPVSYTHLRAHETRHDLVCR